MMNKVLCSDQYKKSPHGRFFIVSRIIILCFFLFNFSQVVAQSKYTGFPSLIWPKLYDIKFENVTDNLGEYQKPIFSQATKSIEAKIVSLPGYMVPFDNGKMKGKNFILTSLPLQACFFCGVGGPESVIEINLKEEIIYTEKLIEVQGILRLNESDPDRMVYRLEQAVFLGEVDF
jgi:hypothetical protein